MLRATTYFKVLTSGMLKRHLQQGSVPSHKTATCAHNLLQTLSHSVLKIDQKHVQHYVSIIAAFIYMYWHRDDPPQSCIYRDSSLTNSTFSESPEHCTEPQGVPIMST